MDSRKLNELLRAFKAGDYDKLKEIRSMVSDEDYERALELFNQYSGKPEAELLNELARLKSAVPNHQEMIDKIRPFLNEEQLSRLDKVVEFLNNQD